MLLLYMRPFKEHTPQDSMRTSVSALAVTAPKLASTLNNAKRI